MYDVRLEAGGKRLAPDPDAVWFRRVCELLGELAGRNDWQRFPDPRHHPTQHAFFVAEGDWWHEERTPEERARHRRELVLDHLEGTIGAFIDAGNVYPLASDISLTRLRTAAGFGVRYRSPVGPIRVDWGFNLDRRELAAGTLERGYVFHVSLGQAF